jgi:hypothetical protein
MDAAYPLGLVSMFSVMLQNQMHLLAIMTKKALNGYELLLVFLWRI